MGCSNGKQHGEKGNYNKRATLRKPWRFPARRTARSSRPLSCTDCAPHYDNHPIPTRPVSMFDDVRLHESELKLSTASDSDPAVSPPPSRRSSRTGDSIGPARHEHDRRSVGACSQQTLEVDVNLCIINNSTESLDELFDENHWKYYLPLTLEKISTVSRLQEIVFDKVNHELLHVLNRLKRCGGDDGGDDEHFHEWICSELEYHMSAHDEDSHYEHKPLIIRSIEQERFDCLRHLFDRQLLQSKLDINLVNEQGRHCLLMLAHKNGPIDIIEYLLSRHLSCLDTNKLDLNTYSALHHACRNFNLAVSQLLLPHTNRRSLQTENSELHTPLDYWIECLCSLKKLKPTHIQHHSESLRLDSLLSDSEYHSNVSFFQTLINHGGQLTKSPLRYIRSILPQLTFEQKLAYVDHHVNLCCTLYKNRLSTLVRDYDNLKISIQAGEVLTELIYALGSVQLEVQNRLAAHACSTAFDTANAQGQGEDGAQANANHSLRAKEQVALQATMRLLYFKFFRLFQCIYSNPDVVVKSFQYEHIFRRVWIYWKEPVRVFVAQCKQKNISLKSLCRMVLFKRLVHYPADIQRLPINLALKQFVAFDNQFFLVHRQY